MPQQTETGHKKSQCRSCEAEIYWDKTASGKDCPYDWGTEISHFTTCPNSSQHSSKQHLSKEPQKTVMSEVKQMSIRDEVLSIGWDYEQLRIWLKDRKTDWYKMDDTSEIPVISVLKGMSKAVSA